MRSSDRRRMVVWRLSLVLGLAGSTLWAAVPAAQPGLSWYRGNTHCHSFWSDGDEFPRDGRPVVQAARLRFPGPFRPQPAHGRRTLAQAWRERRRSRRRPSPTAADRFGADWVELRGEGEQGRRCGSKTLAEVRGRSRSPAKYLMIQAEEITRQVRSAAESRPRST